MRLAQFSVGPAEPVEGANKNYESEGRTFESFRARHFFPPCETVENRWPSTT